MTPGINLPQGISMITVEQSKYLECTTKKKWLVEGEIRKKIDLSLLKQRHALVGDDKDPYLLRKYLFTESEWKEIGTFVLVVNSENPNQCKRIALGSLEVPLPVKRSNRPRSASSAPKPSNSNSPQETNLLVPLPRKPRSQSQINPSTLLLTPSTSPAPSSSPISSKKHIDAPVTPSIVESNNADFEAVSSLPPLSPSQGLDLLPLNMRSLPGYLKEHSILQLLPFLDCFNEKSVDDTSLEEIIRKIGAQQQNYCFFLVCHTDPTRLRCFGVKGNVIKDWGQYSLYIKGPDESSKAPIYIAQVGKPKDHFRETGPKLLDKWLRSLYIQKKCDPYNDAFATNNDYRLEMQNNSTPFDSELILEQKHLPYEYPDFAHVFAYNAENKLNIPMVLSSDDSHKNLNASSYFFFKKDEARSDRIVLVFCEQDKKVSELAYNIVTLTKKSIELCCDYHNETSIQRKQFIDLKILYGLLKKNGLTPIYALEELQSLKNEAFNPFLEEAEILFDPFDPNYNK